MDNSKLTDLPPTTKFDQHDIRGAALDYINRGWAPVPLPRGAKGPVMKGWQGFRATLETAPKHFDRAGGVGLILDAPSGGLCDVDLDCAEAVELAATFLPPTELVSGRGKRPASHWWYVENSEPVSTKRFTDPNNKSHPKELADDKATLLELRGAGAQTVVAPSVHPSGDVYCWDKYGVPAEVRADELLRCCGRLAAACLLARRWPKGARHEAAMALAGSLARAGWVEKEIEKFVVAVATTARDSELDDRRHAVQDTCRRLRSGEAATGKTRLVELIGEPVVKNVWKWLMLASTPPPDAGATSSDAQMSANYEVRNGEIWRLDKSGATSLCSFTAVIDEEITYDDGAESKRLFVISGALNDGARLPPVRVWAIDFANLDWITERGGAKAIRAAGPKQKEQLREAIQRLSNPKTKTIYRHTGWRSIEGQWAYLFLGGAVGAVDVAVEMDPPLNRFELPADVDDVRAAVEASARLLRCGPMSVMGPLLAANYLAALAFIAQPDFVVWLNGPTGSFKSELAALAQGHFGNFERKNLPVSWSSTENSIEAILHTCKDAVVVVDDFAPQSDRATQQKLNQTALRIIRNVGNGASRSRLAADLTRRPDRPPRSLVLSTGEQLPPGQSINARLVIVEVDAATLNLAELSSRQADRGLLRHAMRGYIEWLKPQISDLQLIIPRRLAELRTLFQASGHRRQPEAVAQLALGFEMFCRFAIEVKATSPAVAEQWRIELWDAFRQAGARDASSLRESDPARRFLHLVRSLFAQGKIMMLPKLQINAANFPLGVGDMIGWYDERYWYLDPDAATRSVFDFLSKSGEHWPHAINALGTALKQGGFLVVGADGRPQRQVRAGKEQRRVFQIPLRYLQIDEVDEEADGAGTESPASNRERANRADTAPPEHGEPAVTSVTTPPKSAVTVLSKQSPSDTSFVTDVPPSNKYKTTSSILPGQPSSMASGSDDGGTISRAEVTGDSGDAIEAICACDAGEDQP